MKFFLSIVWWLSEKVGCSYEVANWYNFIIAIWWFVEFFYNYMNLLCMKFMNFYIYYLTLSTPGDLLESSYIFSNWIIPNSFSLDIISLSLSLSLSLSIYIYIYIYIYICISLKQKFLEFLTYKFIALLSSIFPFYVIMPPLVFKSKEFVLLSHLDDNEAELCITS